MNVCSTIGKWDNCPHVISQRISRKHTIEVLKRLLSYISQGDPGNNYYPRSIQWSVLIRLRKMTIQQIVPFQRLLRT